MDDTSSLSRFIQPSYEWRFACNEQLYSVPRVVVLSAAKDLHLLEKKSVQVLRVAQDDNAP
jgi:hypothetical protein